MKHNTHIYIAAKAIDLIKQSVDNTRTAGGRYLHGGAKTKARRRATTLHRALKYYKADICEATWAPDDVLHDNDPFHIFKLFTDEEFPDHDLADKFICERDGTNYYCFGGGVPYRVDHISLEAGAMARLRGHNDQFTLRQVTYQFMLLSHYVVDAHVPMHCDLRDDPPSDRRGSEPSRRRRGDKPEGLYMNKNAHADLEGVWDKAATPVAVAEKYVDPEWAKDLSDPTEYSPAVTFTFDDAGKGGAVEVPTIARGGLMRFMIDVCVTAKQRGQLLFPIDNPQVRDDTHLEQITREVFSDAIGNLIAIWNYIWANVEDE